MLRGQRCQVLHEERQGRFLLQRLRQGQDGFGVPRQGLQRMLLLIEEGENSEELLRTSEESLMVERFRPGQFDRGFSLCCHAEGRQRRGRDDLATTGEKPALRSNALRFGCAALHR